MKANAIFEFDLPKSNIVFNALIPELSNIPSQRTTTNLKLCNSRILLEICAKDIVSLRAALNTWLRLIKIAYEISELKLK